MDAIDYRLVLELQKNGRESSVKLAQKLGISDAAVRRRVARLLSSGTIEVTAIPSPEQLGLNVGAWIGVQSDPEQVSAVGERLKALPEAQILGLTTGRYDYFMWVQVRSNAELRQFLTDVLAKTPGVRRTETWLNLETLKRSFGQLQEKDVASAKPARARRRSRRGARGRRGRKA